MSKDIITKIIKREPLTEEEFNKILVDYIKEKKGKDPSVEELTELKKVINAGLFTLEPMIDFYVGKYKLQLATLIDLKTGTKIRIDVYE